MKADEILKESINHLVNRGKQYDGEDGERSMEKTVKAFNAVTGQCLTTAEGWLIMVLLKSVRAFQGSPKADDFEDGASYFALMGEEALKDRNKHNGTIDFGHHNLIDTYVNNIAISSE